MNLVGIKDLGNFLPTIFLQMVLYSCRAMHSVITENDMLLPKYEEGNIVVYSSVL